MTISKELDKDFQSYINSVQDNLAYFTVTDDVAIEISRGFTSDSDGDKRFLTFEILNRDNRDKDHPIDIYVSDELRDNIIKIIRDSNGRREDFLKILKKNFEVSFNRSYTEGNRDDSHEKCIIEFIEALESVDHGEIIENMIDEIISNYTNTSIPSCIGATAVICEAWHQGKLNDTKYYEEMVEALFWDTKNIPENPCLQLENEGLSTDQSTSKLASQQYQDANDTTGLILEGMMKSLKLDIKLGDKLGYSSKEWEDSLRDSSFQWTEYSLIHRSEIGRLNSFFIHYPLIADDYFFLGLAYLSTEPPMEDSLGTPDMYDRNKYPKMRLQIDLISTTIKNQRRTKIIQKAEEEISRNIPEGDVLFHAIKGYFTCFTIENHALSDILGNNEVSLFGIKVILPEWLLHKKDKNGLEVVEKIKQEIKDLKEDIESINYGKFSINNSPEHSSKSIQPCVYIFDSFNKYIEKVDSKYVVKTEFKNELLEECYTSFCECINSINNSFNINLNHEIKVTKSEDEWYGIAAKGVNFKDLNDNRNKIGAFIVGLEWKTIDDEESTANFGSTLVKLLTQLYPEVPCFIFSGRWNIDMLQQSLSTNTAWYFYRDIGKSAKSPVKTVTDNTLKKHLHYFADLSYSTYKGLPNENQFKTESNRTELNKLERVLAIKFNGDNKNSSDNFKLLVSRLFTAQDVEIVKVISSGKSGAAATFFARPTSDQLDEATRFVKVGHWLEIQKEYAAYQQVIKPKLNNHIARVIQPPAVVSTDFKKPMAMLVSSLAGFPEVYENIRSLENIFDKYVATPDGFKHIFKRLKNTIELVLFPLQLPTYPKCYYLSEEAPCIYTGVLINENDKVYDKVCRGDDDVLELEGKVNLQGWLLSEIKANDNDCIVVLLHPITKARIKLKGEIEDVHDRFGALWVKLGMPVNLIAKIDPVNLEMKEIKERLEGKLLAVRWDQLLNEIKKRLPKFASSLHEDPTKIFSNGNSVANKKLKNGKFGGIHGDLNLNNILYPKDNTDGFLIDFSESSLSGLSVFDLAWLEGQIWNYYLFPNLIELTKHLPTDDTHRGKFPKYMRTIQLLFNALEAMNESAYPDEVFESMFKMIDGKKDSSTALICLKNVLIVTHSVRSLVTKKLDINFRARDIQYALTCCFLRMSKFDIKPTNSELEDPLINILSYLSSTYYLNQFYPDLQNDSDIDEK
jgi:Ternary complex associated domain 9